MDLKISLILTLVGTGLANPSPRSLSSEVIILSDNDLQGASGPGSAFGALYLSRPQSYSSAEASCAALGEELWTPGYGDGAIDIIVKQLKRSNHKEAWISSQNGQQRAVTASGTIIVPEESSSLPVVCSQEAPYATAYEADTAQKWRIGVEANNETVIGFRDHVAFRFLGVRFAPEPRRFAYPTMYVGSGQAIDGLESGPQCMQIGGGSEDCLWLNIWTPYLPNPERSQRKRSDLKPVIFWNFGGGFYENSAGDPNFDGGNIASRGDVVMVAVNSRVLSFGYLALDDGKTNGNFGLADQILALEWVREHIQDFGGDPERITLVGQSSGAASTRAIMASPRAAGKFVGAIPMSAPSYKGTVHYFTIDEQVKLVSEKILNNTGCYKAPSELECLRDVDADTLIEAGSDVIIGAEGHGLTVDGTYLTSDRLDLSVGTKAPYRLMMGIPENDGDPFITFPPGIKADELEPWLYEQDLPIPPSHLFPLDTSLKNETLAVYRLGGRIRTDQWFRCNSQATAYAALENEVFDKIYYFEFGRTFQTPDWPRNDFCEPPRRPGFPDGDPNAEVGYSKCHSGQLLLVFGNVKFFGLSYRGEGDEAFEKQVLDTWAAFVWGREPQTFSDWKPAVKGDFRLAHLDWPKWEMIDLRDLDECQFLGEPLDYLA